MSYLNIVMGIRVLPTFFRSLPFSQYLSSLVLRGMTTELPMEPSRALTGLPMRPGIEGRGTCGAEDGGADAGVAALVPVAGVVHEQFALDGEALSQNLVDPVQHVIYYKCISAQAL